MAKIGKDVAEQQFQKLCVSRRIATDLSAFNAREKELFKGRKESIVRLMVDGTLVLNDDGNPVYTPPVKDAAPIVFYRATAAVLMEGDTAGGPVERLLAMATALTKSVPGKLAELDVPDFRAVDEITAFLIGR